MGLSSLPLGTQAQTGPGTRTRCLPAHIMVPRISQIARGCTHPPARGGSLRWSSPRRRHTLRARLLWSSRHATLSRARVLSRLSANWNGHTWAARRCSSRDIMIMVACRGWWWALDEFAEKLLVVGGLWWLAEPGRASVRRHARFAKRSARPKRDKLRRAAQVRDHLSRDRLDKAAHQSPLPVLSHTVMCGHNLDTSMWS